MKTFAKYYPCAFLVLILAATAFSFFAQPSEAQIYASSCTISTSTARSVGHQASTEILATSSNRAWAIIQVRTNETNAVFLNFASGNTAVVNQGMSLGTSTEDMNEITFGRNTEFPYVGSVTGITNVSSTTVLVTECNY